MGDVCVDGIEVDLEDSKMCLERITKRYKLKERKTIYGWKIFKRTWDFQTHLDNLFMGGQYLPGKTYIALRGKIFIDGTGESYPSGFHVYATVKGAKTRFYNRSVVCKVKLSEVQTKGIECAKHVYVGRRMKILKPGRKRK